MKHRRLTWYYHSGQATIKGNFKQKPIDMLMSTTQAAVVLLFNSGQHFSTTAAPAPLGITMLLYIEHPSGRFMGLAAQLSPDPLDSAPSLQQPQALRTCVVCSWPAWLTHEH